MDEVKPFLKWAGGKTQLLSELDKRLPDMNEIDIYAEPFVGGGAMFFYLNQKYKFKSCYIFDMNEDLIITYQMIKNNIDLLIDKLKVIKIEYFESSDKEKYYYDVRKKYNTNKSDSVLRAAQIIFLNHTCFNGLFRVNKNGEFNVPYGKYSNPKIYDEENLRNVSNLLSNTFIIYGDFTKCKEYLNSKSFVYFDPPYRPLSKTSSFTSYSKNEFNDKDQIRLAKFCNRLNKEGVKFMLSNSDPKNEDINDNFFDDLFSNFNIDRILAKRMINSNGSARGSIKEIIVTNY